jgi:hypothetical protein
MQLGGGFIRRVPGGMLKDPGDVRFVLDCQKSSPLERFRRNISPADANLASIFDKRLQQAW